MFHHTLSPFSRYIRVQMAEKRIDFELREENFWERREEFLKINPAGEIPVLIENMRRAVCGHYAISEYLEESYKSPSLLGNSSTERAEVRRLVSWFNQNFYNEVTKNLVHEKVFKKMLGQGHPDSETIRAGKRNIVHHMNYISFLSERRGWLAGERFTLADIAASAQLSVIDYINDVPWDKHESVKEWYSIMKSRPSFRALLTDRAQGFRPPAHYANLDF